MPWNSAGSYILPSNSLSPDATAGTTIVSADFDQLTNDLETALTLCIAKDGQSNPTADLPMATNKHTGVGDATALTDYASANQVVDNTLSYCVNPSAVGTDAYVVSLPINPVAYAAGNRFQFLPDVDNENSSTVGCTVNFNSIGVKNIKMADGTDPYDGAIQANVPCDVMYDGTSMILMNPYFAGASTTASAAELNYNDITTLGTTQASKVLTADGSVDIDNSAATWTDLGAVTTTDINGGTVDGAIIGGAVPAAITGTTIKADTNLQLATGAMITEFETISTNSTTKVPTSSAMETYADAAAAAIPQWSDLATFNTLSGTILGTNTSIPSTATKLELLFYYVSNQVPSGDWQILLGTGAGTFGATVDGSCNGTQMTGTGYDCAISASVASTFHGSVMFTKATGNVWSGIGQIAEDGTGADFQSGGTVTLGATLTSVRVATTSNGFDGSSAVYVKVFS